MRLITCESCGSIVKGNEVRGKCAVCGKRTCIGCAKTCDECLGIICPTCIRCREIWRDSKHYFRKVCKRCR